MYETIREGICATDMDGRIIECNQAYADMLGHSKDELKNLTYQQLTPKKWHQMEAKIVKEQIMTKGYSEEYDKEYIRKDGTVFPVSVSKWLIRGKDGKPEGMLGIVRNITERKRAVEEQIRAAEARARAEEAEKYAKELEEKVEQLEKYTKVTVSRELRMVELKKRIKELEEKLKKITENR